MIKKYKQETAKLEILIRVWFGKNCIFYFQPSVNKKRGGKRKRDKINEVCFNACVPSSSDDHYCKT